MHASLVDLEHALRGPAAMSTDLEQMSASLAAGQARPKTGHTKRAVVAHGSMDLNDSYM